AAVVRRRKRRLANGINHGSAGARLRGTGQVAQGRVYALDFAVQEEEYFVLHDGAAHAEARLVVVELVGQGALDADAAAGRVLVAAKAVDRSRKVVGARTGFGQVVGNLHDVLVELVGHRAALLAQVVGYPTFRDAVGRAGSPYHVARVANGSVVQNQLVRVATAKTAVKFGHGAILKVAEAVEVVAEAHSCRAPRDVVVKRLDEVVTDGQRVVLREVEVEAGKNLVALRQAGNVAYRAGVIAAVVRRRKRRLANGINHGSA
nr:hypothetical protein [Tanacetum cinerariifolium]